MANNILFLTGLFPKEIRAEIVSNSKYNTQFAADALQWSFVEGMTFYYKNFRLLNFPFVGSYPTLYKTTHIQQFAFGKEMNFDGLNIGYFNFIALKNIDIYNKVKKGIFDWAGQTSGKKTLLIYAAYLPFLKAAIAAKKEFADLKIVVILPDMPIFMGGPDNIFYRAFKRYNRNALEKCFHHLDGYVLISEYMTEMLPVENKKWTVVEGISNAKKGDFLQKGKFDDQKIILYTGTLSRRYGILNLLEAFRLINNDNYKLIICGSGDTQDEIALAAKNDSRIIYKGSIDRPRVLELQRDASLLVNPRTPEGEFTKFSFPSKTMEYLASGVPTLLYKLPGIPEEYYDHCFSLEDLSISALAAKITEILSMDPEVLAEKGSTARQFILDNKNPRKQCEKVFKLIEAIN